MSDNILTRQSQCLIMDTRPIQRIRIKTERQNHRRTLPSLPICRLKRRSEGTLETHVPCEYKNDADYVRVVSIVKKARQ